jgi:hypothetical protein
MLHFNLLIWVLGDVLTNLQGLSKQYEKPSTKELDARDTVEQQH